MDILIRSTPAEVAAAAADIFVRYANAGATLGLATGSTPVPLYQELVARCERGEVSFARSRAFLLDEYVGLDRTHEQSYYSTIRRVFTSHVDFNDELVQSPEGDAADPDCAAASYDQAIRHAGGIDIHLLLLATGAGKATAVRNMVEGPLSAHCPASILQLHPRATVILDEDAASQLEDNEYYRFVDEHRPR